MRNTLGRDGRSYSALTPTSSFIGEALNEEPFEYNSFFECRACHKEKLEAHNSGKAGSKNMNKSAYEALEERKRFEEEERRKKELEPTPILSPSRPSMSRRSRFKSPCMWIDYITVSSTEIASFMSYFAHC